MKRFFTIVAAALMTSAFATSTFAAWGTGGWGVPVGPPVGQSSKPSTNPASAPITTPFNPNGNLGAVPGSYKDPVAMAGKSKAYQAMLIAKAKANFDKKQYSPRLAPQNLSGNTSQSSGFGQNGNSGFGYGSMKPQYQNGIPFMPTSNNQSSGYGGNSRPGSGYFGNDVLSRPGSSNNYPQYPTNMGHNYPKQSQLPMGGYGQSTGGYGGQSSGSGWGGYGKQTSTGGYGGASSTSGYGQSTSGYGGQSQYGMFAR